MTSNHMAKMAEMAEKKTLLEPPPADEPLWPEVLNAVGCLTLFTVSMYALMVIGTGLGL